MLRMRLLRCRALAVSQPWRRQSVSTSTLDSSVLSSTGSRRRSRSKWRRRALVGGSIALLFGLSSSSPDDPDSPLQRQWLLQRCSWMLGSSFAAYTDVCGDLFGNGEPSSPEIENARAARRMLWWDAIQRSRLASKNGDAMHAPERLMWILLDLMVPPSDCSDVPQEDRDDLVQTLVDRGVLKLLVDYVATEKPTDPILQDKLFQCLELALAASTRIHYNDQTIKPSLSIVRLGVALDVLIDRQEIPRYGDLVRLAQSLQQFQVRSSDPTTSRGTRSLLPPHEINDQFGQAIRGYLRMLSPDMPSTMKGFAMDCLSSMLQTAVRLPECVTTQQLNELFTLARAEQMLALPSGNISLQQSAAALTTSLLQASQVSSVPVHEDVYESWMRLVRTWATGASTNQALQLASANCLRVLSDHPRTRHFIRDSPETMEALFTLARQLHETQVTPPTLTKKKNKWMRTQTADIELPSMLDQVEQALTQKHLSKAFLNVCASYKSGGTAILETVTADTFHTKRQLPMSRAFHGAHDLMDLPVYGADEYDASTEFGWVDILTHWTGSSDRDVRRNAIECLVHLVEQESDTVAGVTRQRLLLQAWLASMLQHVRNVTGGEEILAVKQVEDIARISDEFTPGNEKVVFNPAVVDAGASALAILAEQHYDELIHFGVVQLMSLLATKSPSDKQFDFATQSARVIANLVAACSKTLEHHSSPSPQDLLLTSTDVTKSTIPAQPFSFHHPLWKTFFAEVFDIGQMLETTASGHKLLEIVDTWRDQEDPYQRSQLYRARANLAAYRELARSGRNALPIYAEGVHPIVPHGDVAEDVAALTESDVDVVFVHGLRGDAFGTWRTDMGDALDARSDVWPDILLYEDLKHLGIRARILSLGYEAGMVSWSSPWPSLTLQERAKLMLNALYAAHVGDDTLQSGSARPVVFVTHSMGGILVKKMLLQSNTEKEDPTLHVRRRPLAECTKGVVFLAVPHFGSDLARGARSEAVRSLLRTHPAIQDLCASHDRRLESLNDSFAELGIDCLSIAEQKPAPLGFGLSAMVVKPDSANPGIGSFFILPNADHMTICKAKHHDDPMYLSVLDYVMGHIKAAANPQ